MRHMLGALSLVASIALPCAADADDSQLFGAVEEKRETDQLVLPHGLLMVDGGLTLAPV